MTCVSIPLFGSLRRPAGAVGGIAGGSILGEDLHREELYPDITLLLERPGLSGMEDTGGPLGCGEVAHASAGGAEGSGGDTSPLRLRLSLPGASAVFDPSSCRFSFTDGDTDGHPR